MRVCEGVCVRVSYPRFSTLLSLSSVTPVALAREISRKMESEGREIDF